MSEIIKHLQDLDSKERMLNIEKSLMLKKALSSDSADEIYKAQSYIENIAKKDNDLKYKSLLLDPQALMGMGYREKSFTLSYTILRAMARVPIIKAIIETRKEQIINFIHPQRDKYTPGFVIRKKSYGKEDSQQVDSITQKKINSITDFILNCGKNSNAWHGDDFNSFTRKVIDDSLTLDQATFEMVDNKLGELHEFFATDGATYRISDTYGRENEPKYSNQLVNGYLPYYVQVYQGAIVNEFYPWELCFGVRNPQPALEKQGYGKSELEDLIETVTAILNSDKYNANFFTIGSAPKGLIKVSGNVNPSRIEEFKTHWQAQVAGVRNSHKTPVIEADKLDFVNLQGNNRDMEYSRFQEYLIKIVCACYKIDPSEIGFPMNGSSDSKPMFEGNNEARLKYSKDKGLRPLLHTYESWINKYIMKRLDQEGELEFAFVGLDAETPEQEDKQHQLAIQNWETINEIRRKRGLKDIQGGDIIANPIFYQASLMQQYNQQAQAMQQIPGQEFENEDSGVEETQEMEDKSMEDPFQKALQLETDKLFK